MDQIAQILDEHKHANLKQGAASDPLDIAHIDDMLGTDDLIADDPTPVLDPGQHVSQAAQPAPEALQHSDEIDAEEIRNELYAIKSKVDLLLDRLHDISKISHKPTVKNEVHTALLDETIVEGTFNGEKMIGPDGKEYAVPPNYASKSKLVEGDTLKLTIRHDGSFLYKQIGPIARKRIMGILEFDSDTQKWHVAVEGTHYKILTASVTFYKANPGDEVIILVPENCPSNWGAVENVIKK